MNIVRSIIDFQIEYTAIQDYKTMLKFRIIMAKNYKYYKYVYKQKYRIILKSSSVVEHHLLNKSNDNTILKINYIFFYRYSFSVVLLQLLNCQCLIDTGPQVLYDPNLTGSNKQPICVTCIRDPQLNALCATRDSTKPRFRSQRKQKT